MQWQSSATGSDNFVGFGTRRGLGTSGGVTDCPDDYSYGWHVYLDGAYDGQYFCRDEHIDLDEAATGYTFKLVHNGGSCDPGYFCPVFEGTRRDEVVVNSGVNAYGTLAAGGEVKTFATTYQNRVHYYDVQKHHAGSWSDWQDGESLCESQYDVTVVSPHNFTPEHS